MLKKQVRPLLNTLPLKLKRGLLLVTSGLALGALVAAPVVHADVFQQQIDNLNNANSQAESVLGSLQTTANNDQDVVSQLQAQIDAIQNSINVNQAAEAADNAKIANDQAQIAQNKAILSDDIKTMYVDGQMTTIEELATSQNLSDYVDAQQYRTLIQDKITSLLQTIQTLESAAQTQKDQVSALLSTEQSQQSQVAADQAQENELLSANQSQQQQYNQQIGANNAQITKLRAEQAAYNASIAQAAGAKASSGSGGACDGFVGGVDQGNGGYPAAWCNAEKDAITDSNGFPNRECTSFAYWYFTAVEGESGFQVSGNAGWWWETSNYPVSTYPDVNVGAIGVEPSSSLDAPVATLHTSIDGGYYGHVMIVLALPGTTYNGSFPYTSNEAGTVVPAGDVLVMSMNEDGAGHFLYNLWPANYLMYINPQ